MIYTIKKVSILYNSEAIDFCLQRISLVLQFADGPCALARLRIEINVVCRLIFLKKSGFWSL